MKRIKNFDNFIDESVRNKMKSYLTPEQIDVVVNEDDLNTAMYILQGMVGVTDGYVCGVYFSNFDDAVEHWIRLSLEERKKMVDGYLAAESADRYFMQQYHKK